MDKLITRTIDELGRIVLPHELRKMKGWEIGDQLSISVTDNAIILTMSERHEKSKNENP
ncbi:MAG: AbrB/MazE/SpoVT family DNA-binding domain-containing protein [Defluviitaleaceae bacterium]|nr:AbrB/MazE/SpoVT family DNA-binding domain-containing protein [Defluviitaleaceae bacterium]